MAEGGMFAWKTQRVDHRRGPVGSYRNLSRPLPDPPKDMHWIQDLDTHEWQLTKITIVTEDENGNDAENHNSKNDEDGGGEEEDIVVHEAVGVADDNTIPRTVQHKILPTDTFQGICLKYKITPTELRRANGGFSGTNLLLAPHDTLQIPLNSQFLAESNQSSGTSTTASPAQKIRRLQIAFPSLSLSEVKCYLELNDWDVEKAKENARDDGV